MNLKTDDWLPEHRVVALIEGMPRCLMPAKKLRAAILEVFDRFAQHLYAVEEWSRSPVEQYRAHAKSRARTARKLLRLLDADVGSKWPQMSRLKSYLKGLVAREGMIATRIARSNITASAGVDWLLYRMVAVFELATGEPAKMPWTDRITGEVRGPLLDFILLATADAFANSP
jgi:hypothetical protein